MCGCDWSGLTLQGLRSNSNIAADWSGAESPSPENPAHMVRPVSWLTELWQWVLSSERPLSVWDRWQTGSQTGVYLS